MIKEHNGSIWQGKAYSKIVDTTQQVTSFPVVVRPMENTIPSWTIKGNMQQTGTPSPDSPIQPSECGERTGNLLNPSDILYDTQFDSSLNPPAFVHSSTLNCSNYIPVTTDTYLRMLNNVAVGNWYYEFDANKNYLRTKSPGEGEPMVISNDASYIVFNFSKTVDINKYMFARTSTPLPYEPYGYKLTISSASTTTPVYLGEVQTTRRIKKLVLTGKETVELQSTNTHGIANFWFYALLSGIEQNNQTVAISTHFAQTYTPIADVTSPCFSVSTSSQSLYLKVNASDIPTANDMKTYLQQQYANGTPVTIWYVLATETTTILNEPLRKIGTYADSVSGTNLSVTAQSPTTIDVDTSLKPSEMDLTYTGLKMCKRKKRVNGAWV